MYWLYENNPTRTATIHRATCRCCNDGQGVHHGIKVRSGQWQGPFALASIAESFSTARQKWRLRWCGHCFPDWGEHSPSTGGK